MDDWCEEEAVLELITAVSAPPVVASAVSVVAEGFASATVLSDGLAGSFSSSSILTVWFSFSVLYRLCRARGFSEELLESLGGAHLCWPRSIRDPE